MKFPENHSNDINCLQIEVLSISPNLPNFGDGEVSLPAQAINPTPCGSLLSPEHRKLLHSADGVLLRDSESVVAAFEHAGITRPYTDPAFRSNHVYASFLKQLHSKNLITYRRNKKSWTGSTKKCRPTKE